MIHRIIDVLNILYIIYLYLYIFSAYIPIIMHSDVLYSHFFYISWSSVSFPKILLPSCSWNSFGKILFFTGILRLFFFLSWLHRNINLSNLKYRNEIFYFINNVKYLPVSRSFYNKFYLLDFLSFFYLSDEIKKNFAISHMIFFYLYI